MMLWATGPQLSVIMQGNGLASANFGKGLPPGSG